MIEIEARNKNRIVTAVSPGKAPIRIRPSASMYFWNPMELLCAAVGGCLGGILVDYCRYNELNPAIFELLSTDLKDGKIIATLQHPKEIDQEHLSRITQKMRNCEISRMLNKEIEINLIENSTPVEVLTNESRRAKGCCGG